MRSPVIYHGDCREIFPTLATAASMAQAVVITDPPYNVGYEYDGYDDKMPPDEYLAMLKAVCPKPCVIIHYPEAICRLAMAFGEEPTKVVAWVYPSNTARQWRAIAWWGIEPDFTKESQEYKNPTDRRIQKLIMDGKRARLYDWWEINQVKNVSDDKEDHPCQIPLAVMRRIIKITAPSLVIDPFCGTGTTLLAAMELGIPSIGIERNADYCQIARSRTQPQLDIIA